MNFKEMTAEALETRCSEIAEELRTNADADLDALEAEARGIKEELEVRKAAAEQRKKELDKIAESAEKGKTIMEEREVKTLEEVRASREYVDAYAEYIKSGKDNECRKLLTNLTATSTGVPVPTYVEGRIRAAWQKNDIMDLVRKTYVPGILKVGFERSADPAYIHTEGANADTEEALTLGVVTMTPASIKKCITVSDEAMDLTGEEFIDYIYDELTYQIAKKAQSELLAKVIACTASATSTAVAAPAVAGTPSVGIVAKALGNLSDQAANPVIVMNRASWAQFKEAAYSASYGIDPFEGLDVKFDSSLPAYTAAGTTGSTWMIVGDFAAGAQANFPNGDEINIKRDDLSLAEKDLVKLVGREYVGLGIVGDHCFCKVVF